MIASRAQALQEAWNGLWLAQEPYIVPAIPLIGCKMSGVNRGRSMLLGKMDKEISNLQELGKQLCHYIDVNCSLIEELRMEGIEKLATNKCLLVEVEKELSRRITHICNNKSVRDLSSMRHFLCEMRKPAFTGMMTTADESRDKDDSTTNGSCSTQKVTPEGSSDACQRSLEMVSKNKDTESTDSQSFVSKSVATQADNMHPPSSMRYTGFTSTDCGKFPVVPVAAQQKDIPSGPPVLASAMDIKLDIRNHSSSASEERLPKVLLVRSIYDGGLPKALEDGREKHVQKFETGAKKQLDGCSSKELPADTGGELYAAHLNRIVLSELGKVSFIAEKAGSSALNLTQVPAQVDVLGPSVSNLPTSDKPLVGAEISAAQGLSKHLEVSPTSKTYNHVLPSTQPNQKCPSRKRWAMDCASSADGSEGETQHLGARKFKRTMTEGALESSKVSSRASRDAIMAASPDMNQGSLPNGSDRKKGVKGEGSGMMSEAAFESSFTPCSCYQQQKVDVIASLPAPRSQGRCNECGGFLSQSWIQEASQQTALEQASLEAADQVTESPIPATQ